MIKNYLGLIVAIMFASSIMSQSAWTTYNTSNSGIANNYITCISIDSQGNKWIGTYGGGLINFDGTKWTTYNTSNSGIADSIIKCISIDSQGNKWIGTGWGLSKFDGTKWTTYNTSNSGISKNYITCISIDSQGNKWIGTYQGGLSKFDGTKWTTYKTSFSGNGIANNDISCLSIDSQGNKWIGTGQGLSKFDGTNWTTYSTYNSGIANNGISCISIDSQGNKWIGTGGGLSKFDGTNWNNYLSNYFISCISIDSQGNKWFGYGYNTNINLYPTTVGLGLRKFDETNWTPYNTSNSGIANNLISCISIDSQGNKWIVTEGELCLLNGSGDSKLCGGKPGFYNVGIKEQENKNCKNNSSITLSFHYDNDSINSNNNDTINYNFNFEWSWNDSVGNIKKSKFSQLITKEISTYHLYVNDNICFANLETTINQISDTSLTSIPICMITSQNGHNLILWDNLENNYISKYQIYKQSHITSKYELVHEQSKHELSQWLDTNSNNQIERYKISIMDSCGNETELSSNHTTILLSSNLGSSGTVNLAWNAYEGFIYQNFEIWRSIDGNNFNLLSNVANNTYAFIDNNPPVNAYYQVRIKNPNICSPTKRGLNSVISNTVDKNGKSISVSGLNEVIESRLLIYPNPTTNNLSIRNLSPNSMISITDINSREIYLINAVSDKIEVQLNEIADKGMYFIHEIQNGVVINTNKIILD